MAEILPAIPRFLHAHAAHADWSEALDTAAEHIERQRAHDDAPPTLGFAYISDHYAPHAAAIHATLQHRWPGVQWVGSVGVGISAGGVEHFDEPALALMLAALPRGDFQLFSGTQPLPDGRFHTALLHADPGTPELAGLIEEASARVDSGYLFGGLTSTRSASAQFAGGVVHGGLSGVAFGAAVPLLSRVTQGCQPVGPVRRITAATRNVITELDGEPALACLLRDLEVSLETPREALPRLRSTLVGIADAQDDVLARPGQFGTDTRVRHLIGLDPAQNGVAVAELVEPGMRVAFCHRDVQAARRDLVRICAEIREELSPDDESTDPAQSIAGAVYVSCAGRGGSHFGAPSAELQIVRHALGDVPLVGFFAAGEIARRHLYGYTGVLTVFLRRD